MPTARNLCKRRTIPRLPGGGTQEEKTATNFSILSFARRIASAGPPGWVVREWSVSVLYSLLVQPVFKRQARVANALFRGGRKRGDRLKQSVSEILTNKTEEESVNNTSRHQRELTIWSMGNEPTAGHQVPGRDRRSTRTRWPQVSGLDVPLTGNAMGFESPLFYYLLTPKIWRTEL